MDIIHAFVPSALCLIELRDQAKRGSDISVKYVVTSPSNSTHICSQGKTRTNTTVCQDQLGHYGLTISLKHLRGLGSA